MEFVYLVEHEHELPNGESDEKLIGVYETNESAELAVLRAKLQPGFCEHPEGFHIVKYRLGEDHWAEGFFTYIPGEE